MKSDSSFCKHNHNDSLFKKSDLENDTIRIISLRKALKHERERFGTFLRNELGSR